MSEDVKSFSIAAVLTWVTEVLLTHTPDLNHQVQILAEHVLGHPVWTHELFEDESLAAVREALLEQHPKLSEAELYEHNRSDGAAYTLAYVAQAAATFGEQLDFTRGSRERTETPEESLSRIAPEMLVDVVVRPPLPSEQH